MKVLAMVLGKDSVVGHCGVGTVVGDSYKVARRVRGDAREQRYAYLRLSSYLILLPFPSLPLHRLNSLNLSFSFFPYDCTFSNIPSLPGSFVVAPISQISLPCHSSPCLDLWGNFHIYLVERG